VCSKALGADPRPHLRIQSPTGRMWTVALTGPRMTIGRPTPDSRPDVPLEPDPMHRVSRHQCELHEEGGSWYVRDNRDEDRRSANPTWLRLAGGGSPDQIVTGRTVLGHGDVIRIRGLTTEDGQELYWHITFVSDSSRPISDPYQTRGSEPLIRSPESAPLCVEYDFTQAALFRRCGARRVEILLTGQQHTLIRHLAEASRDSGGGPVACSYAELIEAIWGPDPYGKSKQSLRDIVFDLRKKLEPDPGKPDLLQTVVGYGYRLNLCPPNS
jgi:Transcriptional regulatory protein, C terminal/FHA domain